MTKDNKRLSKIVLSKNSGWWRGQKNWHFFLNNKTLCQTYKNTGGNIYFKKIAKKNQRCPKCQQKIELLKEQFK